MTFALRVATPSIDVNGGHWSMAHFLPDLISPWATGLSSPLAGYSANARRPSKPSSGRLFRLDPSEMFSHSKPNVRNWSKAALAGRVNKRPLTCADQKPGNDCNGRNVEILRSWQKSNDGMEGRDTGSPRYDRATTFVSERFRAVGLKPAGDAGSYFQLLALREIRIDVSTTSFTLLGADGRAQPRGPVTLRPNC